MTVDRRFASLTFLCFFSSFFVLLSSLFIFLWMVLLTLNLMNTTKLPFSAVGLGFDGRITSVLLYDFFSSHKSLIVFVDVLSPSVVI